MEAGMSRVAKSTSTPAPIGGLNVSDNLLATPPTDATVLHNFFTQPYGCELRQGNIRHATCLGGPVQTLVEHVTARSSNISRLFAFAGDSMFDVTDPGSFGSSGTGAGAGCDEDSSALVTLEADPYSNHFFYNTVTDEIWRVVYSATNYVFQKYDGVTGAYVANTTDVATFWDEYDLAFIESTERIYLTDGSGKVVILDANDGTLIGSSSSNSYLLSVDPYTDTIWCGDYTDFNNVCKLNADGSRAAAYPLAVSAAFLGGITFSEDYVWIADYNNAKMYRVLKTDGSVTTYDTSVELGSAGAEVNHIAYDAVRDCIWAFDSTSTLRKFSLVTNTFTDSWTFTGTFLVHPIGSGVLGPVEGMVPPASPVVRFWSRNAGLNLLYKYL
jgi:hypothetical protein